MYLVESYHNKNMFKYTEENITRRKSEIQKVTSKLVTMQDYFGAPKIAVPRSWAPQDCALIRPCAYGCFEFHTEPENIIIKISVFFLIPKLAGMYIICIKNLNQMTKKHLRKKLK